MNILFICRHNRFRSRFAESYFKKINKNKKIKVKSSGVLPGKYPLDKMEVEEAFNFGVNIDGKPQPTTTKLLEWANLIVIVADDIPTKKLFNYPFTKDKLIVWKIKDRYQDGREKINLTYKEIKKKVDDLYKKIEERKIKWKQ